MEPFKASLVSVITNWGHLLNHFKPCYLPQPLSGSRKFDSTRKFITNSIHVVKTWKLSRTHIAAEMKA